MIIMSFCVYLMAGDGIGDSIWERPIPASVETCPGEEMRVKKHEQRPR